MNERKEGNVHGWLWIETKMIRSWWSRVDLCGMNGWRVLKSVQCNVETMRINEARTIRNDDVKLSFIMVRTNRSTREDQRRYIFFFKKNNMKSSILPWEFPRINVQKENFHWPIFFSNEKTQLNAKLNEWNAVELETTPVPLKKKEKKKKRQVKNDGYCHSTRVAR